MQNLNYDQQGEPAHIIVSTLGKMEAAVKGRKPMNLKHLKVIVIDEADIFFHDDKNFNQLKNFLNCKDIKNRDPQDQV